MTTPSPTSRFAHLSRGRAVLVLLLTLAAVAWCVGVALTRDTLPRPKQTDAAPGPSDPPARKDNDVGFYRSVVKRVNAGQGYYDAVEQEFQEWQAPPTSVFNWRTPLYAWVLGKPPTPELGRLILISLALLTWVEAGRVVARELGPAALIFTALLLGPFAWCAFDVYLFTELWAGILIALSVCAGGGDRRALAVAAGLFALFLRELVLPFCLLCLLFALWRRRWGEAASWVVGIGCFALFYWWHVTEVTRHVAASGGAQAGHWVRFGGLAFLIGTMQMGNIFLLVAPAWLVAPLLPLALLGLIGWRSDTGLLALLTAAGYLALFAVIGMPTNAYWGLLIAPLLTLGLIALPFALRDLVGVLATRPALTSPPPARQEG